MLYEFHSKGIFSDLILIGSWALPIYRYYFENSPEIPVLRTTEVDFLIGNPPKIKNQADIPKILKEYNFEEKYSIISNYSKFIHPDLEIEFLIPEIGRGSNISHLIKELNITAQPLRYLYIIQKYVLLVKYYDIEVRVPEPSVFTLLKFLLTIKRKNENKISKDIKTAIELSEFLLTKPEQIIKLNKVYDNMPKSWHKKLIPIIEENCPELLEVLIKERFH